MFPAVFLDRDGVLIENRSDYIRAWSHVTIYPKTYSALSRLQKAGYKIVIVTNQSAVGRGLISLQLAEEINHKLVETISENGGHVDGVFMCPHQPEDRCECRKPKPGLLFQAARKLSLDLSRSWMVGDAWSDLLAGQAANLQGVMMVGTGRGRDQLRNSPPIELKIYQVVDDVDSAASVIPPANYEGN